MSTILKIYEITYILGYLNPEERKIKIETINQLTDQYIKEEIERKFPKQKGFIVSILSSILLEEKILAEEKQNSTEIEDKKIPVFNW